MGARTRLNTAESAEIEIALNDIRKNCEKY
jgi:hypothetical protein